MELRDLFDHYLDLPRPDEPLNAKMLPGGGGVCALVDTDGRLIQTLGAQSLRRSLVHRLSPARDPGERPKADLRAIARGLWWQPAYSVFETWLTYWRIARLTAPATYRRDLAFGPVWFAQIQPQDQFPRWVITEFAFGPAGVDAGPFVTRGACRRFIGLLENLFDLCRYHEVLRQAPNGQACAYKEMGRCPAPCDGSISLEAYRRAVMASVEFALGDTSPRLLELSDTMRSAAADLEFERAAHLRSLENDASRLLAADGRLRTTPRDFRYLIVQRGPRASQVKPFFVDRGLIEAGIPATLGGLDEAVAQWTDNMQLQRGPVHAQQATECSEGIWLVSHFLVKGVGAAGLFLRGDALSDAAMLVATIRDQFRKPTRSTHEKQQSG